MKNFEKVGSKMVVWTSLECGYPGKFRKCILGIYITSSFTPFISPTQTTMIMNLLCVHIGGSECGSRGAQVTHKSREKCQTSGTHEE